MRYRLPRFYPLFLYPYIRAKSDLCSLFGQAPSPMMCASPAPEYYYAAQGMPPRPMMSSPYEQEYIGVPLEPTPLMQPPAELLGYPEMMGEDASTADIIASQSQDYVDEKLAEYQATIHQLQGKCLIVVWVPELRSFYSDIQCDGGFTNHFLWQNTPRIVNY